MAVVEEEEEEEEVITDQFVRVLRRRCRDPSSVTASAVGEEEEK